MYLQSLVRLLSILPVVTADIISIRSLNKRLDFCHRYKYGNGGSGKDIIQIFVSTNVVTFPVLINTYIEHNTVLNIYGGKCRTARPKTN